MTKIAHISERASGELASYLEEIGYEVVRQPISGEVGMLVADHPDVFMCKMGCRDEDPVVHYPGTAGKGAALEGSAGAKPGTLLGPKYPVDIKYNAACTGRYLIHSLEHTAPEVLLAAEAKGLTLVNVRQGYTKCSTVIIDEDSIITYDKGIQLPAEKAGMNVLLVSPGHVALPGTKEGFIGGASGRVGDMILWNGDITAHPDYVRIRDFIEGRGLRCAAAGDYPLTDIGSIVTEVV